jgi:lysophospholipid acyltransferase (LPLAT)-like uncharacterized protein
VQLARATRVPIVAIGAATRPVRRLASWDRLQLPMPFGRVVLVLAEPLAVGDGADGEDGAVAALEVALTRANEAAAAAVGATAA